MIIVFGWRERDCGDVELIVFLSLLCILVDVLSMILYIDAYQIYQHAIDI